MKTIIHEVHRRSLWQVLGLYLAGSWVALQIVEILSESMILPDWVQGFSIILLILGLPIVLATAFVQEGVGRKHASAPVGPPVPGPGTASTVSMTPVAPTVAVRPEEPGRGLLTWRRASLAGVGGVALLIVALVGWVILRSLGIGPAGTLVAKGILEERATLLLTDFEAEDPSLSRAATAAIRIDLSQSSVIQIADPGFVMAALARMQLEEDAPLDARTGRDLAQREGMPALIVGEVTPAGTGYVLTAQILTAETGEILVGDRETASDDSELVGAIDRLSKKLRERIGESLGDLAAALPLARVTTADLAALRLYSRALALSDAGRAQQSVDLLEEAVALDTSFAMAWRKLGMLHTSSSGALGQYSRGVEALERAFQFRDRLTERERLLTTAGYYDTVVRDPRRAADAYEQMLANDPDDPWALNNLALVLRSDLGDYEEAERLLIRAVEVDTLVMNGYWNLSVTQSRSGKYDAATETLELWKVRLPDLAVPYQFQSALAGSRRDYEAADSLARYARTIRPGSTPDASFSAALLATSAHARGRLAEGDRLWQEAEDIDAELGPGNALGTALNRVWTAIDTRGDAVAAARILDASLARYPLDQMGRLDPPWGDLVSLGARVHGSAEARETLALWETADPAAAGTPAYDIALAWIDIADGAPEPALRRLEGVRDPNCVTCSAFARLAAWRVSGPRDSVIAYAERFIEIPGMFRLIRDASTVGPELEGLARLYDEAGDLESAARTYAEFVELWKSADEELQPRVRAAQARLEEILRERG